MATARALRLKPIRGVILGVLLVIGLSMVMLLPSPDHAESVVAVPNCVETQLAVTGVAAPGGSLHAGVVIHYRNVSATACSLTGYSNVVGINFEIGKSRAARRVINGYLGGWVGYKKGKTEPLPLAVLRARDGEASSMVEWADGGTDQQPGCSVLTSLWVNMPGGRRPFALKESMLVCGYFDATPIVPGVTGSAQ
jgi:hypothetical protein